jgi:hypothetical protein
VKVWFSFLAGLLILLAGCESAYHTSSSRSWSGSSFSTFSGYGSYGYQPYPRSVQLPDKPISQMNKQELEQAAQAINWANQINRGYRPSDWPHERRLDIWLKKP